MSQRTDANFAGFWTEFGRDATESQDANKNHRNHARGSTRHRDVMRAPASKTRFISRIVDARTCAAMHLPVNKFAPRCSRTDDD